MELTAVKVKLKVNPAGQTVTANGFNGTYDGNEHGITVTPADQNATVYYSETELTADNYTTGSSECPKFSTAGTHPVYYYVVLPNHAPVSTLIPIEATR